MLNPEQDQHYETRPYRRPARLARIIAMVFILAVFWGAIWLVFFSGLAEPVLAVIEPYTDKVAALINDPLGVDWGGYAVAIIAAIAPVGIMLLILFDDRLR